MAGYFESDFWNRVILQIAVHEPSIFHGAVALAALHERTHRISGASHAVDEDLKSGGFAMKQYNRAIKSLLDRIRIEDGRSAVDVVLMTNLLFACIEVRLPSDFSLMTDMPASKAALEIADDPHRHFKAITVVV